MLLRRTDQFGERHYTKTRLSPNGLICCRVTKWKMRLRNVTVTIWVPTRTRRQRCTNFPGSVHWNSRQRHNQTTGYLWRRPLKPGSYSRRRPALKDGPILFFKIDTIPSTILTFFFKIDIDINTVTSISYLVSHVICLTKYKVAFAL